MQPDEMISDSNTQVVCGCKRAPIVPCPHSSSEYHYIIRSSISTTATVDSYVSTGTLDAAYRVGLDMKDSLENLQSITEFAIVSKRIP
jgi:hypothetical protein